MNISHIYLGFLGIGVLGLLISIIFGFEHDGGDIGHDFDVSHDGDHGDSPKIFSLRIIFSFLMAFAIGGGSMYLNEKSLSSQMVVGFLAGVVTAAFVYYLMKFLYSQQGNSNVNSDSFVGQTAVVTVGTTKMGLSQIRINSQGGDELFMAKESNGKELKQNDTVVIEGKIGTTLLVTKQ